MPENPSTALVKAAQSPALARVSNQLALTDKLLTKPKEPFLIPYRKGNKWRFCDRNKNIVINCVYDDVVSFREKFAGVRRGNTYEFIDVFGNLIYSISVQNQETIHGWIFDKDWIQENTIIVNKITTEHKYEFINLKTKQIIKFGNNKPLLSGNFSNGLIACSNTLRTESGFVNTQGQIAIPQMYKQVGSFSEGLAPVKNSEGFWCLINPKNEIITEMPFKQVRSCSEGLFGVCNHGRFDPNTKYGYADRNGKIIINLIYDQIKEFSNGLASVKIKSSGWGFIDKNMNIIIEPSYELVSDFNNGIAWVKKNGKFGVINKQNKILVPFRYKSSKPGTPLLTNVINDHSAFRNDIARIANENREFYIDSQGNEYFED